jgi:hypothetical protein
MPAIVSQGGAPIGLMNGTRDIDSVIAHMTEVLVARKLC